ncbi:MAG: histidinol dehydrogenase [Clostridia bacterium]|nr:histidinol dehydrogenase [Clostridia bacterium]
MIRIIDSSNEDEIIMLVRGRNAQADEQITAAVAKITEDVKNGGDEAVRHYTKKFDGVSVDDFEVSEEEIEAAYKSADPALIRAMEKSARNIYDFHKKQLRASWESEKDGARMGQRIIPLKRAALYVPGGRAAYPSSVLMNAVPALVAGVSEVFIITPPGKDGTLNPNILAAAKIAGVKKIYKAGGAQGVAAAAYGTESIPRADKIVGPGNIYVATAKRLLYGVVDIDMIAGPSEVMVIADDGANPAHAAADMLSQAEHDVMASAILLCLSEDFAKKVKRELKAQTARLSRRETIERSLSDYSRIVVCESIDDCIDLANEIAPEHLEIMLSDAAKYLDRIRNAGAVFLGPMTPEPIGDYIAGPSHVLPTGGSARFFSGLNVDSFIKKINYIEFSDAAFLKAARDTVTFAMAEGFDAHAGSVSIRMKEDKGL